MSAVRPILGFACRFVLVFGLLIAPWPGWEDAYARFFQKSAATIFGTFGSRGIFNTPDQAGDNSPKLVFGSLGSKGLIAFAPYSTSDKLFDTIVYLGNRERIDANGQVSMQYLTLSSRILGYLPTALVIALVLATGIGWRRRLSALAWGILWVHVFVAFLVGLMILSTLCANPSLGLLAVSPFWQKTVSFLHELFAEYIGTHLAVAVPIWIAVTFRRDDWVNLLGKAAASDSKPVVK